MRKILITDTTLRDAHQFLLATRMKTEDMLPICEVIDKVGFHSLEMFGGATFDSMMRFLNEDPWERVEALKEVMLKTPIKTKSSFSLYDIITNSINIRMNNVSHTIYHTQITNTTHTNNINDNPLC